MPEAVIGSEGLPSKAISQSRLDGTFPGLLNFTGVCTDNGGSGGWLRPFKSRLIKTKVKLAVGALHDVVIMRRDWLPLSSNEQLLISEIGVKTERMST